MLSPATTEDVLIDLSTRTKLCLSGADRLRFLNGQVSNDMRRASAAESVYTCVMTIKGKMCADAFVHAGDDFLLLDAEPELRESLAARLERYIIADDVQLVDVTDDFHLLHLLPAVSAVGSTGDAAPRLEDLPGDPALAGKVQVVQSSRYGTVGIDLFVPALLADDYRAVLASRFRFLGEEEAESRRIAAGVPRWGTELGEDTMPAEAGLESRAVSYQKGCYIGQEVVSRVKSVGHVNWQLRGFRLISGTRLEPGMVLRDLTEPGGRDVGHLTSVSRLPVSLQSSESNLPGFLALGYVRRPWDVAKTRLAVFSALASVTHSETAQPVAMPAPALVGQVEVSTLPFSS